MRTAVFLAFLIAACATPQPPREDVLTRLAAMNEREGRIQLHGVQLVSQSATLKQDSLWLQDVEIETSQPEQPPAKYFAEEVEMTIEEQRPLLTMMRVVSADGSYDLEGPVRLRFDKPMPNLAPR